MAPTPDRSVDAQELEDLFENAPCGYISAQADGRLLRVNRTFLDWTGYGRDQLTGRRFQDLLNIAGKIYYETHFAPLLQMQGFFNEVALDIVRADGTPLPVLVNAVERREEAGGLDFIRITIFNASDRRRYERDLLAARKDAEEANVRLQELNRTLEERVAEAVEERLTAEDALRQAQKMEAIGQLTGGIAHDFNNLLTVILSAVTLLERRLENGNTDVGRYVAAAREGVERAANLTSHLLAFSRQQALSPEPLNPNRLASGMSDLLRRTLGETVHLETVLAGGVWGVYADANQLENAIINLAVNARDAMPDGGRLTIETANRHLDETYAAEHAISPGPYVMIAVTDTGVGMTPAVVAKAFDPFFTTKDVGRGTGLGLSQVFGFVKQSGGHVKIHSEPGHGTSIRLYLPRHLGAPGDSQGNGEAATVPASHGEAVLVVEDDEQVLELTVQMMRDLGYGVLEARDGAAALKLLDAHPEIRLLFTDMVMPDMNGRRLAEEARRKRPDLKVLFTTGYSRSAVLHNGVLDPEVTLLPKPASLEQLATRLRDVLDGP